MHWNLLQKGAIYMKKIVKGLGCLWYFFWGNIFGRIIYSKDYFPKGVYFKKWYSQGWKWTCIDFWGRFILKRNCGVKWTVSPMANVGKNIEFDVNDLNNFQGIGCYFQTWDACIHIGKGTYIAQNTGFITSNHNIYDLNKRDKIADIYIGDYCWIGMNSVVLPGVHLGNHTVVGAGSVVTHSFEDGYIAIAGNPARIIKKYECSKFSD